ncbi:hypothetical protein VTN77DRAFT_4288 [Rasamsonia byssochlamydoides]|uniref:uncharacterized protein n=1 Tax=Rasamsonia byssochlamydoides TaxID=89139 RepID=UPI0037432296
MSSREPPRGFPSKEPPPSRGRRPGEETRNDAGVGPGDGTMSRAQIFQDEKRRIIQSCFSKKDSDGALSESYITHIRITEDAAYPSTPPPPNSPPENKKPRLIIVALRKSGRVRMHKARENNDGSFSIGKTWMLDDLVSIQSYTDLPATTPQEQQQKQWASNVGFVVTIGKPYYWQAANYKERDFFIASLVKIYKKYTGGRVPKLIGFDERQRQTLLGDASQDPSASVNSQGSQVNQQSSQYSNRAPSRDGRNDPRQQQSEEQFLKNQRSRDQVSRPSTAQSPARPGLQIPNALNGRLESDRVAGSPKSPLDSKVDFPSRPAVESSPESIRTKSRGVEDRTTGRPPPSRDGKETSEFKPFKGLDVNKEPLRPSTASSVASNHGPSDSSGQKTLLTESNDTLSKPSSKHDGGVGSVPPSRGNDRPNQLPRNLEVNIPASLRPGSSGSMSPRPPPSPTKPSPEAEPTGFPPEPTRPPPEPTRPPPEPTRPPPEPTAASSKTTESPMVSLKSIVSAPLDEPDEPDEPAKPTEPAKPAEPAESAKPAEQPATSPPVSPPEKPATEPPEEKEEVHRPGLGPMVKKKSAKDLAGALRRAANAYNAFRPRPGGAGERLMAKQKAQSNEPDGITSVVPAPSLRALSSESTKTPTGTSTTSQATTSSGQEPPKVEITRAATDEAAQSTAADETKEAPSTVEETTEQRSRSRSPSQERRRKRREDNVAKYCQALGIDPSVLEGRVTHFDNILTDLGWNGRLSDDKKIEDLEADIRREIGRVQATSWLGNIEHQEGKIDQLARLIDKTIEECDELDGLLTLYSHELSTLHDDVAYIEAQSQGLQVQTANQKLLQNELQNLLKTLSISSDDLRPLKEASLSNPDGIKETETVLSMLYKAMLMIDSDIRQNKKRMADGAGDHSSVGVYADTEVGQMRAIREKKEEYRVEAGLFLQRLKQFMSVAFRVAEQKRVSAAANSSSKDPLKLDSTARNFARQELWMYNALMLFAREVSSTEWTAIISLYEQETKGPYQSEFRDHFSAWQKAAKKATGDAHELLFTSPEKEKESDGITTAARRLTVRRGKTVRTGGLRLSVSEKQSSGKLEPFEVFGGALQETLKMISEEQNFAVQFFHLTSLANTEFPDVVAASNPEDRRRPDLSVKHSHDPDRDLAKKVEQMMDGIYSFWQNDMQNLVDWVIKTEPLQGVGVLAALERAISEFEETNQDFIVHSLQKLHSRLNGLFNRFVEEQIRGIEETKVKVNKRRGVISFMRIFPNFSAAIENMLAQQPSQEFSEIRTSVNEAYNKINRAMWESLKFIAKEAPGQQPGATSGATDPEDKEVLNYHILLIENMNHYIEEVDVRGLPVLERWRDRAIQDYHEHMRLYMDAVIRRPLGKLLDFIESAESLLGTASNPPDIAARASHSRSVAKKLLASYDSKEVRRGAEMLRKRVEKHFGDADDPGLSQSLVAKVFKECETRYAETYDRIKRIIDSVYDGQVELEWSKEEAIAMFRRG